MKLAIDRRQAGACRGIEGERRDVADHELGVAEPFDFCGNPRIVVGVEVAHRARRGFVVMVDARRLHDARVDGAGAELVGRAKRPRQQLALHSRSNDDVNGSGVHAPERVDDFHLARGMSETVPADEEDDRHAARSQKMNGNTRHLTFRV